MLKNREIIEKMSLEQKVAMFSGKDTWQSVSFEQYNIPSIFLSDGPHGLRKQAGSGDHLGINASLEATCFPTAATVANSWDEELAQEVGKCIGEEALELDVQVVLGPGLNIKRSPLGGRNFEYFSEDPYLSGKMAAAYIRGIQENGIAACPKHFAANSQELRRMANNSIMDERTFREIYATGFEIAVKEGRPKVIMSSYNELNGIYANENYHLLQEVLRDEWGFDGFVVSDWGGSNDHALEVKNGSHLEMPGTGKLGAKELLKGINEGKITEDEIDARLDELLTVILELGKNAKKSIQKFDRQAHNDVAKKAAKESIVLLKNSNNILPLPYMAKVVIIGDFAKTPRYQGAGSSLVNPTSLESLIDVIKESGLNLIAYEQGYERNAKTNETLLEKAVTAAKHSDYCILAIGLDEISECEGMDRTNMRLPKNQIELIEKVAEVSPNTIAVISAGSVIEMPWIDKLGAVLNGYLGGQAGAGAMADVLTGKYNPSGKLNETYPLRDVDEPCFNYFPSKERNSEYRESVFVGYRYYETSDIPVRFPFGYGLSYTTFEYSELKVSQEGVTFTIKNTGKWDGAEIAQLYISRKSDDIFRPKKELKGFKKIFLKAGESKAVKISFDERTFRYFNVKSNSWEIEGGSYTIMICRNARETKLTGACTIEGTDAELPYKIEEMPSYFSGKVKEVLDNEFKSLLGREIPDNSWSGQIGMNDAFCQLYYAKSSLARLVYKILKYLKQRSEKKGKPDLNVLFIYNMPFRGLAKMTNGAISMDMASALTDIANGHFFKGLVNFIKAAKHR